MLDKLALTPGEQKNYHHPNFINKDRKLYLVRCFMCGDLERGRENWAPAVASGQCAWCGWSPRQDIIDAIVEAVIEQVRNGPKRGLTLDEIKERYPDVYEAALEGKAYDPSDTEDDGYPD